MNNIKINRTMKPALTLLFIFFVSLTCLAQIQQGMIVFERKTNLYKKFKDSQDIKDWLKEEDKIKVDVFELWFNDTTSLYKPQDSELREFYAWATDKNQVRQYLKTGKMYMIRQIWQEEVHIADSLVQRPWKITNSTRKIAGYTCRKAVWQVNDSLRIYAWFSYDIIVPTGPENFGGLPGTILGLATEDGGMVYFAKKVVLTPPTNMDLEIKKKKSATTRAELIQSLTKKYGHEKWFKKELHRQFDIY